MAVDYQYPEKEISRKQEAWRRCWRLEGENRCDEFK